jgi:hypothetical protein
VITIKSVNDKGRLEIQAFLLENHKYGSEPHTLRECVQSVDFRLCEGYGAVITLSKHESVSGQQLTFKVSKFGIDTLRLKG